METVLDDGWLCANRLALKCSDMVAIELMKASSCVIACKYADDNGESGFVVDSHRLPLDDVNLLVVK